MEKKCAATSTTCQQMQAYNINFPFISVSDIFLETPHLLFNWSISMFLYFIRLLWLCLNLELIWTTKCLWLTQSWPGFLSTITTAVQEPKCQSIWKTYFCGRKLLDQNGKHFWLHSSTWSSSAAEHWGYIKHNMAWKSPVLKLKNMQGQILVGLKENFQIYHNIQLSASSSGERQEWRTLQILFSLSLCLKSL